MGYEEGDFYFVKYHKKDLLIREIKFTKEQGHKIRIKNHLWLYNPVLNRSGLVAQVWDDDVPNKLRRRHEIKGERNSFTDEEKIKIKAVVKQFYKDVVKAFEK